ncbi:unnamed protein product, partial [Amoebophrya sp. A25]|eukprot:GSA25T00010284001.1
MSLRSSAADTFDAELIRRQLAGTVQHVDSALRHSHALLEEAENARSALSLFSLYTERARRQAEAALFNAGVHGYKVPLDCRAKRGYFSSTTKSSSASFKAAQAEIKKADA